jgi:RNA polymerase sigma factor (sigma-70 family)
MLYRTYVNDLFAYAVSLGFDRDTSKDAVQDVFCKLCADRQLQDKVANVRLYLFSAMKNRLLDIRRTNHAVSEPSDEITELTDFTVRVSVEDEYIENEMYELLKQRVQRLMDNLTDRQREIIWLRFEQNLDYGEIAQLMNITGPSCRKLVHKAMEAMRKKF